MMKKGFRFLVTALCICLSAVMLAACGNTDPPPADTAVFTFTGSVTIDGKKNDVVLKGQANKSFILSGVANEEDVTGTYVFQDGKGYTFKFNDSKNTEVKTTFDTAAKEHSFEYVGDKYTVTLKLKDDKFVPEKPEEPEDPETPETVAVFNSTGSAMGITVNFTLTMTDDGKCAITTDSQYVGGKNGTYVFANNTYTMTIGTDVVASTFNEQTGTYTINYNFVGGEATIALAFTYTPTAIDPTTLTFNGSAEAMGTPFDCTLKFSADGKCVLKPSLAFLAEQQRDYTFVNNVFTIIVNGQNYVSAYDTATKTYSITVPYVGSEASPMIPFTCVVA